MSEAECAIPRLIILAVMLTLMSFTSCEIHNTHVRTGAIVEAIQAGAHPIAARCAVYGPGSKGVLCANALD